MWIAPLLAAALAADAELERGLREAGLSRDDLAALRRREVVVRVLETPDRSEIAAAAAVRVRASRARFVRCAADPRCLDRERQAGRLELPAMDLDPAAVETGDLRGLAECRVGRCTHRLEEPAIDRLRGREPSADVLDAYRKDVAAYGTRYWSEGNAGLPVYADRLPASAVRSGLERLLERPFFLVEPGDPILGALAARPGEGPQAGPSYLAWSRQRMWRKTVLALGHVLVDDRPAEGRTVAAVKQVFANHYHESALELLVFADGEADGLLAFVSRTRADIRPGGFSWLERVLIRRLVRGRLEERLQGLRQSLETPDAALVQQARRP
jgi:hypothetical protein